jgi:hypothetical protein
MRAEIKATATNAKNPSQSGSAIISLAPTLKVSVSPQDSKVKLGGSLELSASAAGVDPQTLQWTLFPAGGGSIRVHDDGNTATYHAPASVKDNEAEVKVVVYSIDDDAGVGVGSAEINLVK